MSTNFVLRNFFKQFSYALSVQFPTRMRQSIASVCPFSPCNVCFSIPSPALNKPRHQWRCFSISSSSSATTSSYTSPYLSALIFCRRDIADMLSEALLCFGASSTSMDKEDSSESADEVCISSIFMESQDVSKCILNAADSIGLTKTPRFKITVGEQVDWLKKTQESFHPVEVTKGLWIVPEWITPPDVQAKNIIINPGLAFGTGDHPTTKLCLLLLHDSIKGGELFLDYGTGSGILAIAAVKFGAALSSGIDIEPQAITSARYNAALNNIGPKKMELYLASDKPGPNLSHENDQSANGIGIISGTKYDVVIANILLNPLLDLAEHIVSYAKPGAIVGLSGILSNQLPYIMKRYSQLLENISVNHMDDWACLSGKKKINLTTS